VFKRVSVLSGGEKSRLALAKMLLSPSNLIVLDEPTNHLDMRSKAILQEALLGYEGSYVIVSHDRDFLDPIVSKVVEFKQGKVKTYLGNVSEYLYTKEKERRQGQLTALQHERAAPSRISDKDRKRQEAETRQKRHQRVRPVQKKIEQVEKEIEGKEREKKECEALMGDPEFYKNGEKVKEVAARLKALEGELGASYFKWNQLTKELELLAADNGQQSGKG